MKYLTLVVFSLALAGCGGDNPEVLINSATHSGEGCPAGTGEVILSSDRKTLSVLFEDYNAEAGAGTGPEPDDPGLTISRIACNIAVSLHIPSGYQAFLIGADFRGAVSLPEDGRAEFNREYFFAGDSSPILTASWSDEVDDDIEIFDDLYADTESYSRCGEDVILRSNTSLLVEVPDADSDTAIIQIDSFDYQNQQRKTQFDFQFSYARCE